MTTLAASDYVTVFYYGTFLPVSNGGNTRLVELLDRLSDDFERVLLYCYSDHPHAPWTDEAEAVFRARWPRMELVLERYGPLQRIATRCKNLLITLAPHRAAQVIAFRFRGTTPRQDSVMRRSGAVILSYTEALTQVNGIDPARCIVETHDLNFLKWSKIHQRSPHSVPALRKFRSEMGVLEAAGTVLAISPVEFAFFRLMLRAPHLRFLPTWRRFTAAAALGRPEADWDLVFVGSDYIMNVRGFCDLLAEHGGWLRRYRIAVCGRVCLHPAVREAASRFPNVDLLGYVDDLGDIYRRSRAALSPVDGTGSKMKLLAALAAGLPVFASRQSRDALPPGSEGAVFPVTHASVISLLDHEDRRERAAAAALRYSAGLEGTGDVDAVIDAVRSLVPTNGTPQQSRTAA